MNNLSLRIYFLICTLLMWLKSWAQDIDDDDADGLIGGVRSVGDLDPMDGLMDYQPFRIRFTDILIIVLLLLACYVFGKIWKGCSYLLIFVAVVFYFLLKG